MSWREFEFIEGNSCKFIKPPSIMLVAPPISPLQKGGGEGRGGPSMTTKVASSTSAIWETWKSDPKAVLPASGQPACLVHIYPTGPTMGTRFTLGQDALVIGRGQASDIQINDPSVSRRHTRIEARDNGIYATDLRSTNGTRINEKLITSATLQDGDSLRIGNSIFRFLTGDNLEAQYHEEIYRLTIMDSLTQIHNKRYLLDFLDRELKRSGTFLRPLTLVMFDIDHFKKINDDLGHLAGDHTLRELAGCLKYNVREEDLLARYGGEEFALVLVETPLDRGVAIAEGICRQVAFHPFLYDGTPYHVTISLGVASATGNQPITAKDLIDRADTKLYDAKRQGRNQVRA